MARRLKTEDRTMMNRRLMKRVCGMACDPASTAESAAEMGALAYVALGAHGPHTPPAQAARIALIVADLCLEVPALAESNPDWIDQSEAHLARIH